MNLLILFLLLNISLNDFVYDQTVEPIEKAVGHKKF
jgi:hypothetical protein